MKVVFLMCSRSIYLMMEDLYKVFKTAFMSFSLFKSIGEDENVLFEKAHVCDAATAMGGPKSLFSAPASTCRH